MSRIEAITITTAIGGVKEAFDRIHAFTQPPAVGGTLLGAFTTEIGELNKVLVLRAFETDADAAEDRNRAQLSADPYGVSSVAASLSVSTYALFPFLEPVTPGTSGPFYEVRTYGIKPNAVQATIDAWEKAVPARTRISPLTLAAYALDGPGPRFINIWPYASLDARNASRAQAVEEGTWPPKGGPANLTTLNSEIYIPAPFSPLQ
ncbi:NIPSNAP family protein [Arthrobacter sp. ISL-85]|uniref:NIPSNAP family protein n=1 Tax=Arthrobacter sp. ISL-85 TaxID=2819115 RepID=UPI001BEA4B51|nr:NIPSNAP family protein [Arthrobacter sp. ISL-85]MBT2565072.1 NIPSNAP family protein [Arthrobacter sp. ISL-85]